MWSREETENYKHISPIVGFLGGSVLKNLPANTGDMGSIPGLGRSPGEENGHPSQCSCLENPMDRGTWQARIYGVTKDVGSIPGSGRSPGEGHGNLTCILAWRIPWTEEPGRLQSIGSQRVDTTEAI